MIAWFHKDVTIREQLVGHDSDFYVHSRATSREQEERGLDSQFFLEKFKSNMIHLIRQKLKLSNNYLQSTYL